MNAVALPTTIADLVDEYDAKVAGAEDAALSLRHGGGFEGGARMTDVRADIASLPGRELLAEAARRLDFQASRSLAYDPDIADLFTGAADVMRAIKIAGEHHVQKNATKREKGERIWRETDETVDHAVGALRSAFIRGATARNKPDAA
jgi:hypothetical protein